MAVLKVATCQFPVSADIGANLRYVSRQLGLASQRGARVAHFPEGALSGYAGTDFASFAGFGWEQLDGAFAAVAEVGSAQATPPGRRATWRTTARAGISACGASTAGPAVR